MDNQQQNRQQIRLLLTPLEAARALGISERNLWTLTQEGVIDSVRVGKRSIRYSVATLEKWIARQEKSA